MNRFKIVDGLPYLFADGKFYAVRWDDKGFTVGAEVNLTAAPDWIYGEREILARCRQLDSIGSDQADAADAADQESVQADAVDQESVDLESMTVAELKEHAAAVGIEIKARATKAEIIAAIRAAE